MNVNPDEGFILCIQIGWKKLNFQFVPGERSGLLLISMGQAAIENKAVFCAVAEKVISNNGNVNLIINGKPANPRN